MSKIGMIGGAAIAATFAATVFYYHPSYASDALLAKAQSEFTAKARDALLQRRLAPTSTASLIETAPQSEPVHTYVVASLEPVAPPRATAIEVSQAAPAPIPQTATAEVVETPAVVAPKLPDAEPVVQAERKQDEAKPEVKPEVMTVAALPAEVPAQNVVAPKETAVSEVAAPQVTPPVVTQAVAPAVNTVVRQPAKVVQKTTQETVKEPVKKTNTVARHTERGTSREQVSYNVDTLRARAPEIAAALSRYMQQ
jgi:hypothetical protein